MIGLGTIINTVSILLGSILGHFIGKLFSQEQQKSITHVCGICVILLGIAGAMEGMLRIENDAIGSGKSMLIVLCLAFGCIIGELIGIEKWFENFATWLKNRTGNSKDSNFIAAFVSASLTVCIGAMAIVGAIQDGILNNYNILAVKSVLDFIIIAAMTSSMGKGCAFSAIPVFFFEGSITLLANLIAPIMTSLAVQYISLIGSILIFCVGLNLIRNQQLRVANMLPAIVLAVIAACLPFEF